VKEEEEEEKKKKKKEEENLAALLPNVTQQRLLRRTTTHQRRLALSIFRDVISYIFFFALRDAMHFVDVFADHLNNTDNAAIHERPRWTCRTYFYLAIPLPRTRSATIATCAHASHSRHLTRPSFYRAVPAILNDIARALCRAWRNTVMLHITRATNDALGNDAQTDTRYERVALRTGAGHYLSATHSPARLT